MVQLEETNRRAPGSGAGNEESIRPELEVVFPGIATWMVQGNDLSGLGIDRRDVTAFVFVAERAGKSEIVSQRAWARRTTFRRSAAEIEDLAKRCQSAVSLAVALALASRTRCSRY